jgi:hypothetical protein
MPQDRLEIINQQGPFYRNNFRLLLNVGYVLLGICFCLVIYIFYQYITTPPPSYFATTIDGRMIEIFPES